MLEVVGKEGGVGRGLEVFCFVFGARVWEALSVFCSARIQNQNAAPETTFELSVSWCGEGKRYDRKCTIGL